MRSFIFMLCLCAVVGAGAGLLTNGLVLPTYAVTTEMVRETGRADSAIKTVLEQERTRAEHRAMSAGIGVGMFSGGMLALAVFAFAYPRSQNVSNQDATGASAAPQKDGVNKQGEVQVVVAPEKPVKHGKKKHH